jgi:hypothetical protein
MYISILDLQTNRVVKLGKGAENFNYINGDERSEYYEGIGICSFDTLSQSVNLIPSFQEGVIASDGKRSATVRLLVEIRDYEGIQRQFDSISELWKFLEICMTGKLHKC